MRILFFYLLILLIALSNSSNLLKAQTIASPLDPGKLATYRAIGFVIGLGNNMQSGKFETACPCFFSDGTKFGYSLGIVFDQSLFADFYWGIEGLYDYKGIKSSYLEKESFPVTSTETGKKENVNVLFRHIGEADFSAIIAMPFLKWYPVSWFFFKFGVSGSFIVSSKVKHTKELQQTTALLSTGEIVKIEFENTKSKSIVVEEGDFPEVNSPVFSLDPMIGFDFKLDKRLTASPVFMYSLPLNNISEKGIDFKISTFRFYLELKYIITGPELNPN